MAVPTRPASGAPIETAWGDIVHDTAVAMDIQCGTTTITMTAAETGKNIVFPRPFAAPPVVVVAIGEIGGTPNRPMVAKVSQANPVTATQFQAVCQSTTATVTSLTLPVWWIAMGPRA